MAAAVGERHPAPALTTAPATATAPAPAPVLGAAGVPGASGASGGAVVARRRAGLGGGVLDGG